MRLKCIFKILFAYILLCYALPANTAHAQQQGFRWGKWSEGQRDQGTLLDKVVDSYVDSAGNTYILGQFGLCARMGGNGPYICPIDSIDGYMHWNNTGVFLAKIDSLGNLLWCKSTRNGSRNSGCASYKNIVVDDDKITIAFSCLHGGEVGNWFYFFDTMLIEPDYQVHTSDIRTYFVTFDLDGNRLDYHEIQLFAFCENSNNIFFNCALTNGTLLIDEEDNVHLIATGDFYGEDSSHRAYIIVDGDTNRRYPLNIRTQNGKTYSQTVYYKMDRNWNLIGSRFLIDSISEWAPRGSQMANIRITRAIVEGDYIYAHGIFSCNDIYFNPDTFPVKVFLDSVHYLRIDNLGDWETMPCLLKMDRNGEVVWVQQLYVVGYSDDLPIYQDLVGDVALDEENVYAFYVPYTYLCDNRFAIDSACNTVVPLQPIVFGLIVSYNRDTGVPVDYYLIDTVNKNGSHNSLEVIGDELVLNVSFFLLYKNELCKINKYTKEVTRSSPITYSWTSNYCNSMAVNSNGWVFRGEAGEGPRVYDSIFLGNYQKASVMTFFYDSTLDMRRPQPCYGVDTLWSAGTAGNTVTLAWHSPFPHPRYELAYIPDGGSWNDATLVETTDTTATVALPDGQCHLFRVRGLCDGHRVAHGPWSHTVTVCPQVGIGGVDSPSPLTLSPNPTDGAVQILGLQGLTATVEILDMTGRVLATFEKTASFDITALPSGVYTVLVKTIHGSAENSTTLKLVKEE